MTMQRRHLEVIAEIIRDLHGEQGTEQVARKFCEEFERRNICGYDRNGNRAFKPARFLRACGVEE